MKFNRTIGNIRNMKHINIIYDMYNITSYIYYASSTKYVSWWIFRQTGREQQWTTVKKDKA